MGVGVSVPQFGSQELLRGTNHRSDRVSRLPTSLDRSRRLRRARRSRSSRRQRRPLVVLRRLRIRGQHPELACTGINKGVLCGTQQKSSPNPNE